MTESSVLYSMYAHVRAPVFLIHTCLVLAFALLTTIFVGTYFVQFTLNLGQRCFRCQALHLFAGTFKNQRSFELLSWATVGGWVAVGHYIYATESAGYQ